MSVCASSPQDGAFTWKLDTMGDWLLYLSGYGYVGLIWPKNGPVFVAFGREARREFGTLDEAKYWLKQHGLRMAAGERQRI